MVFIISTPLATVCVCVCVSGEACSQYTNGGREESWDVTLPRFPSSLDILRFRSSFSSFSEMWRTLGNLDWSFETRKCWLKDEEKRISVLSSPLGVHATRVSAYWMRWTEAATWDNAMPGSFMHHTYIQQRQVAGRGARMDVCCLLMIAASLIKAGRTHWVYKWLVVREGHYCRWWTHYFQHGTP